MYVIMKITKQFVPIAVILLIVHCTMNNNVHCTMHNNVQRKINNKYFMFNNMNELLYKS